MTSSVYSAGKKISDHPLPTGLGDDEIGIFDTVRTYHGKLFQEEEHIKRFMESAQTAGSFDTDPKKIRQELRSALAAFQKENPKNHDEVFMRITFWRKRYYVIINTRNYPPDLYKKGVVLRTSPVKRSLSHASPPEAKTTAYQNALLATLEPVKDPVHEWLFLDRNGYVTEVRIGNIFCIKDGRLLTPPLRGILNGVTRRFVIECAQEIRLPVEEIPLTRHDFFNADEAFLTNTSWEILPVRELDARGIGKKIPGEITQKLQKIFKRRVKK